MADVVYRGYLIRCNPFNGSMWIERNGHKISYVFSSEHAKKTIDQLTDIAANPDPRD